MSKVDAPLKKILPIKCIDRDLGIPCAECDALVAEIKQIFKQDGWIDSDDLKMSPSQIKSMNRIEQDGSVRKPHG